MENKLLEIESKVNDHELEIRLMESRITHIENNSIKLENTILKEGQETRRILEQVVSHSQNMEKSKHDLWIKLIGSGGIIYILVEFVLKKL